MLATGLGIYNLFNSHLTFIIILLSRYYYYHLYFTYQETDPQKLRNLGKIRHIGNVKTLAANPRLYAKQIH